MKQEIGMNTVCLDLEGVLIPEIWQHVAKRTGVNELLLTTRDVKDYSELMNRRVEICLKHQITLSHILNYIKELAPLAGALDFVQWIRKRYQLIILSDTFYAFADHFMEQLMRPTLFCHEIGEHADTGELWFKLRQENSKEHAVKALKNLNFRVFAAGDSYNDITMLKSADHASFFRAPDGIQNEFPGFSHFQEYSELQKFIEGFFQS